MIPIFIDTRSLSEQFQMTQRDVEGLINSVIKDVTQSFAAEWQDEALRSLGSTRMDYAKNIVVIDEGIGKGAVVLFGWLPNALESGLSPFDMKEKLLSGPNAKTTKSGTRFNTVPYRFGNPMAQGSQFAEILPKPVYDIVKEKPQTIPSKGGLRTQGITRSELPKSFRERRTHSVTIDSKVKSYKHKNPIHQGVTKVKDPVTNQNTYVSFRRVSDNSDPNAWMHPGFTAKNLGERALDKLRIDHISGKAIDKYLIESGLI